MKKILLGMLPFTLLAGCKNVADNNWSSDCEKYASYDSREKQQCEDRLKERQARAVSHHHSAPEARVKLDPKGTESTPAQDVGKGH